MKLPDTPSSGSPITAAWGRQVVDYLRALSPRGTIVFMGSNGSSYTNRASTRGRRPAFTPPPLRCYNASTGTGDDYVGKIGVTPGSINNWIPKMGAADGASLTVKPAPTLLVSASGFIVVEVPTTQSGVINNFPLIKWYATVPKDTLILGHKALAQVTVGDGGMITNIFQLTSFSMGMKVCGTYEDGGGEGGGGVMRNLYDWWAV